MRAGYASTAAIQQWSRASSSPIFASWTARCCGCRALALHELAHAYHDRVLGHGHAGIKAAYERAKGAGLYDKVARRNGPGRTNTFERADAIMNPQEYFAETTEAFFGRNDFFPFDREELKLHDPEMFELLKKV